jgi:DNA-binding NarL/FixJ family response regulator
MSSVAPAVGAGASGVLLERSAELSTLVGCLESRTRSMQELLRLGARPAGLTARELKVLALLGEGLRNADLAAHLHISEKTVDHHVSAILAKLGVRSRREAARVAAQRQLLHGDGDGEPASPR